MIRIELNRTGNTTNFNFKFENRTNSKKDDHNALMIQLIKDAFQTWRSLKIETPAWEI